MTNSVRNSGPDSTRRPGPATDQVHGSGPGTGILCSSHRRYDQVLGSELVGFHVVGRVERRGATGVRRAGFCAVCQRAEAKRASMAIVAACFRATAACFRAKVAGRPALGGEDGPRACRVPADGRGVVGSNADPLGFDSDIATVGLGVSWAAWAATRGGRQSLPDVVAPVSPAPEPTDDCWAGAVAVV